MVCILLLFAAGWGCGGGDGDECSGPGTGGQPSDTVEVVPPPTDTTGVTPQPGDTTGVEAPKDTCLLKVMTYNVRYDKGIFTTGTDSWRNIRKERTVRLLQERKPDVLGAQEVLHNQLQDLTAVLTDYDYAGVGREDGETEGEYTPVFWLKERFGLLEKGHFWYSETPDKPSKGWDAACERICTWVKLKDKEHGKTFFVFNSHYDHEGVTARKNSATLMMEKINKIAGNYPVFCTGDFNAGSGDAAIQAILRDGLLRDARTKADKPLGCLNTYHGYEGKPGFSRIDFIFITSNVRLFSYVTLDYKVDGYFPSDHFPVLIETEVL